MAIPQHHSRSNEHYTPTEIVEAARHVMGGIDLDPATTKKCNEKRIRAERFYTQEEDGLSRTWRGKVWLNPPGGRIGSRSSAAIWWQTLVANYGAGRVPQAMFLGFTLELLATSQDAPVWCGSFPFCVPRKRIEFLTQDFFGDYVSGESPTHSNIIIYLPPQGNEYSAHAEEFALTFERFGKVRT